MEPDGSLLPSKQPAILLCNLTFYIYRPEQITYLKVEKFSNIAQDYGNITMLYYYRTGRARKL